MEVDIAIDIAEARAWWRADLYNLVLMNVENGVAHWDKFCEDLRGAKPPQQIAFLVGKPDYLSGEPGTDVPQPVQDDNHQSQWGDVRAALAANIAGCKPERWGIMEASRRISAVRSLSHARSKAQQERPAPPRDNEARFSKRIAAWSQVMPQLEKEELQ